MYAQQRKTASIVERSQVTGTSNYVTLFFAHKRDRANSATGGLKFVFTEILRTLGKKVGLFEAMKGGFNGVLGTAQ